MTTMTHSITDASRTKRRGVARVALVGVFWIVAAMLVSIAHQLYSASPVVAVVIEAMAIVATAGAYIRIAAPHSTLDHALLVGTIWVLLGIVTEIAMTANSGRQWVALLGSPANGGLRCVLLIVWVIAPALFVRSRD